MIRPALSALPLVGLLHSEWLSLAANHRIVDPGLQVDLRANPGAHRICWTNEIRRETSAPPFLASVSQFEFPVANDGWKVKRKICEKILKFPFPPSCVFPCTFSSERVSICSSGWLQSGHPPDSVSLLRGTPPHPDKQFSNFESFDILSNQRNSVPPCCSLLETGLSPEYPVGATYLC